MEAQAASAPPKQEELRPPDGVPCTVQWAQGEGALCNVFIRRLKGLLGCAASLLVDNFILCSAAIQASLLHGFPQTQLVAGMGGITMSVLGTQHCCLCRCGELWEWAASTEDGYSQQQEGQVLVLQLYPVLQPAPAVP